MEVMDDVLRFDVVVVGSGFGGSVMTHELVSRRLSVCLLERGKQYAPGEFPRSPYQMSFNTWDPSEGLHGMFNLWRFNDFDAVMASGLGGGSLLFANVLLRKPKEWFELDHWPICYEELVPYYEQAEILLGAQRYPFDRSPYDELRRADVFKEAVDRAAQELGAKMHWEDLNLSVSFAGRDGVIGPGRLLDDGSNNIHLRPRVSCQLCGECDVGCNYGAKNTVDYTCLSGLPGDLVTIMPRCEVRTFEPYELDGKRGYLITYVNHSSAVEGMPRQTYPDQIRDENDEVQGPPKIHRLFASQLVLAAGSLGTTFLMLRNQPAFPAGFSPTLGAQFSTNGDHVTLTKRHRRGAGAPGMPRLIDSGFGPALSRSATFLEGLPAEANGRSGRGFFIQDAGFPHSASWVLHLMLGNLFTTLLQNGSDLVQNLVERFTKGERTDVSAQVAHILRLLSEEEWLPLLGIGLDFPDGKITLDRNGKAQISWRREKSEAYYADLKIVMEHIAKAMEADIVGAPFPLSREITVHPLGGCSMGVSYDKGVVDTYGRVFQGNSDELYPGLYIADGAIMPGPVGANPSLTIAAMSIRIAEKVHENHQAANGVGPSDSGSGK